MHGMPPKVRRTTILLLTGVLVFALTACGGGEGPAQQPQGRSTATVAAGSSADDSQLAAAGAPTGAPPTATSAQAAAPSSANDTKDWSHVDVCKLLSKQEVEAALGPSLGPIGDDMAPDPAYSAAEDGRASCRFNDTNKIPAALVAIGPLVMWIPEHDSAFGEGVAPQTISGIGDDAFTWENSLIAKWLSKGVTIRVTLYFQDPFQPDQAKQLAQKLFDRLP